MKAAAAAALAMVATAPPMVADWKLAVKRASAVERPVSQQTSDDQRLSKENSKSHMSRCSEEAGEAPEMQFGTPTEEAPAPDALQFPNEGGSGDRRKGTRETAERQLILKKPMRHPVSRQGSRCASPQMDGFAKFQASRMATKDNSAVDEAGGKADGSGNRRSSSKDGAERR